MSDFSDALGGVGGTPLVELSRVVPPDCATIVVKVEGQNPTGSMKDRMARSVIEGAIRSGRLAPGGRVVEYTGGSTGTSLAYVCAALGYPISIVTSDAFSLEKRDHMRALGADVIEIASDGGKTTKELIERMISTAADLSEEDGAFFSDQFNNPDAASGYIPLGDEIWRETGERVAAFVQSIGTAQCINGVSAGLHRYDESIAIHGVEPAESPVLAGGSPGPHKIEGVGPGFVPPRWNPDLVEGVSSVSTADAMEMTRRLAREEGLFGGTSSGANVLAAIEVGQRLGPDHVVATLLCDSGLKYLSTDLYRSD